MIVKNVSRKNKANISEENRKEKNNNKEGH